METVAKAAVTPVGTAKNCIFILLTGAPSHTDTFDLKEGSWTPSYFNPTSYGDIRFPQGLMPNVAAHLDSIALLRSVRAWNTAHPLAQTWVQLGRNPASGLSKIAPHIGSVVALELGPKSPNQILPPFISLNASSGPDQGYLPPQYGPFYVSPGGGGLANTRHPDGVTAFNRRYAMLQDIDAELRSDPAIGGEAEDVVVNGEKARGLMYNPAVDAIFNFDAATKAAYGNSSFGNACITARNLIRADLGTRFIQISFGTWDHHTSIYAPNANLQAMSRQFDAAFGQLLADLKQDGLLDQTLVLALGEFGRTVGPLNANGGRDHHVQQTVVFAGAGIRGMRAIGSTNASGSDIAEPGWSRNREVKPEDIEATIYSALGIDWTTVRHDDPLNRGFEYVPQTGPVEYGPVNELWS
ncbi:MAG TPA: DUF1501 domain-containing protein [Bryobacteraceae bacterium]|nr:DUF1501 domain-containing protein [Bryobacteraceae bacterium]